MTERALAFVISVTSGGSWIAPFQEIVLDLAMSQKCSTGPSRGVAEVKPYRLLTLTLRYPSTDYCFQINILAGQVKFSFMIACLGRAPLKLSLSIYLTSSCPPPSSKMCYKLLLCEQVASTPVFHL